MAVEILSKKDVGVEFGRHGNEEVLRSADVAVGKGLFAGLARVTAMTLSQQIEMKLSEREPDTS